MADDYISTTNAWRQKMDNNLRARNGWLALAGLFWLHQGPNSVGTGDESDVRLPAGTASPVVGRIDVDGLQAVLRVTGADRVMVDGAAVSRVALTPDIAESPTYVDLGELRLVLIRRGERLGVRLWDNQRPDRTTFPGRAWYPIDETWRVRASFLAHDPPLSLSVPNVQGEVSQMDGIGKVAFNLKSHTFSLEALKEDEGELFLIFSDLTNGDTTYPAGRFLYTPPPSAGTVDLDFNRAYCPPCAFTPYATCPLPPAENHLGLRVEAGELYRTASHAGKG